MQPIYTQTVGSSGAASITFNNIPQTFTDLLLKFSQRSSSAFVQGYSTIRFNGDTASNYSYTFVNNYANFSGSGRASNQSFGYAGQVPGANSSNASTFGSGDFYISNYTGSNFKSIIGEDVDESSTSNINFMLLTAGLWRSTSAITSITLSPGAGNNYAQYSTVTLYGITKG